MDLTDFKKHFKIAHLLHSSCFIAAIMLPSLAGVCTVLERPAFTSAIGVTLPDTHRKCSNCWNRLLSDWPQPEQCSVNSHASVPPWLLQAMRVRSMFQYSMCVYFASFLITTEPCYALFVLSMPNNTLYCCDKQHSWEC